MVVTPHALVGAAGARNARSMAGAMAIGALTHLALDALPHRDYRLRTLGGLALAADTALGTLTVCRLSGRSKTVLAGALGGVLPDVVRLAEDALGVNVTRWAQATIHTESRPSRALSAAIQGLVCAAAALVLWRGR